MYHNRHRKTLQEEASLGAAYGTFDEVLIKADVITSHIRNNVLESRTAIAREDLDA